MVIIESAASGARGRARRRGAPPLAIILAASAILAAGCSPSEPPRDAAAARAEPQAAAPRAGAAAGAPESIRVICDENYPPYAFRDKEGRLEGIVVDQWKAWERATGVAVKLEGLPWARALAAFDAGKAEVLDTVFDTAERRERYLFTKPYASVEVPVFIHKSLSGIAGPGDLRGLKVAVKDGDAAIGELVRLGVYELSLFPSYEAIVDAAARLDYRVFCIDGPPAFYLLYKKGIDRDYRVAFTLNQGAFSRAVRRERADLMPLVEGGFEALPRSTYDAIERKWLGSEIARRIDLGLVALIGGAAALAIAALFAMAWILRRRVARATAELSEKILLLEASEAKNRASLAEKEILLKEIHHRVKNNMQVISSLIQLQSYALRDETDRELMRETQARIRAMAQLHELLYRSPDLASVDAAEYLRSVVEELALGYEATGLSFEGGPIRLGLDAAVPLGLVANELVLNSIKYAYPPGRSGPIKARLFRDGEELALSVSDEGAGLPPGFDPMASPSMGFTIVRSLAAQLYGRLAFRGPPGFEAELRFPAASRGPPPVPPGGPPC